MIKKLPDLSLKKRKQNHKKVEKCRLAFYATLRFRKERQQNFKYYTGEQWSDLMKDPDTGETITEEAYIRKQGRVPAKQNLIEKTIRNLSGQFRSNYPDPVAFGRSRASAQVGEMMTSALQYALDINEANELDAQNLKESAIGGVFGWKIGYKWWGEFDREDVYIENIDTTRLFYNVDATDIRGHDLTMIGELHDMTIDQIISRFGFSYRDKKRISELFPSPKLEDWDTELFPQFVNEYRDFYIADNPDRYRVIEVWDTEYADQDFLHDQKDGSFVQVDKDFFKSHGYDPEIVDMYSPEEFVQLLNQAEAEQAAMQGVDITEIYDGGNRFRLHSRYEEVVKVYFLTPNGDELLSMVTPYDHQSHPYVLGRIMMDGKVISLCSNIRDQQKHVNRLISMMDASLGRSLKRVMMIDEDSIPAQYKGNFQDYADDMVRMDGMIFYTSNKGTTQMPKEVTSSSLPADAINLLNLQAELLKDISAVNDAVQGKQPPSGTPASLYAQQTLNASITNKDIFDFFFGMIRKRNRKVIQVIKQFYTERRHIKISGTGFQNSVDSIYEPDDVKEIDFDVVIGESQNTLAYRQIVDTELKEFLAAQLITFEEYLKTTSMPYADKLLQMLSNRAENPEAGQLPPDVQQQLISQQTQQP